MSLAFGLKIKHVLIVCSLEGLWDFFSFSYKVCGVYVHFPETPYI